MNGLDCCSHHAQTGVVSLDVPRNRMGSSPRHARGEGDQPLRMEKAKLPSGGMSWISNLEGQPWEPSSPRDHSKSRTPKQAYSRTGTALPGALTAVALGHVATTAKVTLGLAIVATATAGAALGNVVAAGATMGDALLAEAAVGAPLVLVAGAEGAVPGHAGTLLVEELGKGPLTGEVVAMRLGQRALAVEVVALGLVVALGAAPVGAITVPGPAPVRAVELGLRTRTRSPLVRGPAGPQPLGLGAGGQAVGVVRAVVIAVGVGELGPGRAHCVRGCGCSMHWFNTM